LIQNKFLKHSPSSSGVPSISMTAFARGFGSSQKVKEQQTSVMGIEQR
jgi:hypothetical protein